MEQNLLFNLKINSNLKSNMFKICIVEDNLQTLSAIKAIIEDLNKYEIAATFNNAEACIEEFYSIKPDITLMDIDLPGMSGIEAVAKIKSYYPRTKVIMLTNHNENEQLFDALKAGADGYLLKKNSFEKLAEALQEIQDGGAPMSTEIAKKVIAHFNNDAAKITLNKLTEKEKVVLKMLADGFLYKEIADKVNITIDGIKKHTHNIYEKLQVRTRSEAIKLYLS